MAQITINIPDAVAPRVINAFAKQYLYSPTLPDGVTPNPETKQEFAKRQVKEFIKRTVRQAEVESAKLTAQQTAEQSVDTDIVLS